MGPELDMFQILKENKIKTWTNTEQDCDVFMSVEKYRKLVEWVSNQIKSWFKLLFNFAAYDFPFFPKEKIGSWRNRWALRPTFVLCLP